jgi:hypothetical protein
MEPLIVPSRYMRKPLGTGQALVLDWMFQGFGIWFFWSMLYSPLRNMATNFAMAVMRKNKGNFNGILMLKHVWQEHFSIVSELTEILKRP